MRDGEIIADLFAGGGGASLGIELALGRPVDIAINHDPLAIAMHAANHPRTAHYCKSVFDVSPIEAVGGRPVGLLWASPDCTHFSRAKGSAPVSPRVRDLAWVVVDWASWVRPRVICLENVQEFTTWGPVCPENLQPIRARSGETFRDFLGQLQTLGYRIEYQTLNAADQGTPTSRKRLFLVARRGREPIRWPAPTHGRGRPRPWRTAAECIDWSIPCPSIFDRRRPLAEKTLQRIARGVVRYVLQNPAPFLVQVNHGGEGFRGQALSQPLTTITERHGYGLIAPTLVQTGYGEREGQAPRTLDLAAPLGTVVAGGQKHALVSAFLAKHFGGVVGQGLDAPTGTITARDHHSLVAAHITKFYGTGTGSDVEAPMPTITAGGSGGNSHLGLVAAFITKYYGQAVGQSLQDPLHTATGHARFGVVTVQIDGEEWAIADIGMRMLEPRELARAQGFPDHYILTGNKAQQVARIGNSVCPPVARALVEAQFAAELGAVGGAA